MDDGSDGEALNDVEVLVEQAVAWLNQDPDPETHHELHMLLRRVGESHPDAVADLRSRFGARLEFGTAGLRGELAAGPNRMNRVLVGQAAAGLAAFLLERARPGDVPSIVIGYDGRKNSQVFARDTAEIMAGAGVRAVLLPRLLPTPLVAFAVRDLDVSAGVMVTASHNPPRDNGYKVYLGGDDQGSQIVAPSDSEIAAHILRVAETQSVLELPRSDAYEIADEALVERYVQATAAVAGGRADRAPLSVVYTAMHGVGWETFARVLDATGFARPSLVEQQIQPDPAFPTVAFPNPEEPGALDLAFERAREAGADLIVANDPDADRLAIAIPDPSSAAGYRALTGNEVGMLLGWRAAEAAAAAAVAAASAEKSDTAQDARTPALACSIVSSPALGAVARHHGLRFSETLTGFKWVSRTPDLVFGYEEALGYLVNPGTVRDKDGISAAIAFLDLASSLAADGRTIADRLDEFSARFGHYGSAQISVRVTDLSEIERVMTRLRADPPEHVGGLPVREIDDLSRGEGGVPPSDVLRIRLDGARVMVRPSGTEPKLKIYLDAWSDEGGVPERRDAVVELLQRLEGGMRDRIS
jgi:phosphomannomutase